MFIILSCLFIAALWSPAGKRVSLGSLVCGVFLCFSHFPMCCPWSGPRSGVVLIASKPDLCLLTYFYDVNGGHCGSTGCLNKFVPFSKSL